MRRYPQFLVLSAMLLFIPLTSWAQGSTATEPLTAEELAALTPSRDMLETGLKVANTVCADCHGLDGSSTGPGVPNLAGQRTVYLYRILQEYQDRERKNEDMNQVVGFLNRESLLAASAYYSNLTPISPAKAAPGEAETSQASAGDVFADIRDDMKKCVKCHGEDGNASGSGMPNLTAQDPEYLVHALQAYRDGDRIHSVMKKLVEELGDDVLERMGVFYAVQEPLRKATTEKGDAELGQALAETCAACHGADGNASGANVPTLAGQDARYFVKAMQGYQEGKRQHEQMAEAAKQLSEADLANLSVFFAAQDPVRRNVRTPLTTHEWINRCERCHGLDGNSTDPRFPMLAGQERSYLATALQSYAGADRDNSAMHAMADPLSQADIERIVEHYATRQPKSVVYMQLPCEEEAEQ